jgi:hypothetical protein
VIVGDKALVLVWDGREPWVYGCLRKEAGHEVVYACKAQAYLAEKRPRSCQLGRVAIGLHPAAMELVSVDVAGVLSKPDFKRHKLRCLAASLGEKVKGRQCFSLGTSELPSGVCKHWVAAFTPQPVWKWWDKLYGRLGKKPEVVVSALWLKQHLESLGYVYAHVAILHRENNVVIWMVYYHDQLVLYHKFSLTAAPTDLFLQKWNNLLNDNTLILPEQLLVVNRSGGVFERLPWDGVTTHVAVGSGKRHSTAFVLASLGGKE